MTIFPLRRLRLVKVGQGPSPRRADSNCDLPDACASRS